MNPDRPQGLQPRVVCIMDTELQKLHTRIREWEIYAVMLGVGCFLLGVIFGWGLTYFALRAFA